ncbi:hypothetical protein DVB69_13855 [Sporosarcina sp. BI001-red]|uniref:hypothetical protein n=1 Tax=Sporosarcina sp. BI001-red TaxID=2282866 RepID=UPI000E24614A|nr:hypothetical protein [Sporosarcina sp. BI001-red]REB06017.1 hypothetical protein DVB69_13855 [Sporosarcina sp. BI001-red]
MKKYEKIGLLLSGSLLAVSLFFVTPNNNIADVHAEADIVDHFSNVEELSARAELILEVDVNSTESIDFGDLVFTVSNNTVKKVYKGNEDMKSVSILETGGIGRLNVNGKRAEANLILNDNEEFKKKDKAIVYLEKYEGPIAKDCYVILGVYQGKFKLKNTNEIVPPNSSELSKEIDQLSDLDL